MHFAIMLSCVYVSPENGGNKVEIIKKIETWDNGGYYLLYVMGIQMQYLVPHVRFHMPHLCRALQLLSLRACIGVCVCACVRVCVFK